jgi:hypothetical protein
VRRIGCVGRESPGSRVSVEGSRAARLDDVEAALTVAAKDGLVRAPVAVLVGQCDEVAAVPAEVYDPDRLIARHTGDTDAWNEVLELG